jgi:hypothetical protein
LVPHPAAEQMIAIETQLRHHGAEEEDLLVKLMIETL